MYKQLCGICITMVHLEIQKHTNSVIPKEIYVTQTHVIHVFLLGFIIYPVGTGSEQKQEYAM